MTKKKATAKADRSGKDTTDFRVTHRDGSVTVESGSNATQLLRQHNALSVEPLDTDL